MIEAAVDDPAWTAALPGAVALATRAAAAALADASGDVAILLTGDEAVRALNARFRGQDKATNVLSFPATAGSDSLGDIALAYGVCAAEARAQAKPLADHLQHLVVHGALHLLGLDHADEVGADAMEARERAILAGLSVPDPYAARAGATHV
ncbi:MAG TPA: rRNA maturation RNase YbeY [Caulobacteraceae bacterium]|nr:rRNA maturation RNase YbeY [Caulobacteraceae bacterium]